MTIVEVFSTIVFALLIACHFLNFAVPVCMIALGLALVGIRRTFTAVAVGAALIAIPFAVYVGRIWAFEQHLKQRSDALASVPRAQIPRERPTTLIVLGYLTEAEQVLLLEKYGFQRIVGADLRGSRFAPVYYGSQSTATHAAGCAEFARNWAVQRPVHYDMRLTSTCIADDLTLRREADGDAIVYARDFDVSVRWPSNVRQAGSSYEVRLRHDGHEDVVAYIERSFYKRPSTPFCMPLFIDGCVDELPPATKPLNGFGMLTDALDASGR